MNHTIRSRLFRWFKTQSQLDFDKAQDYLDSSRILMNSAFETLRSIEESNVERYEQRLELIVAVMMNSQFLDDHLEPAFRKFSVWEQGMVNAAPERYARVSRALVNAKKNFALAREYNESIALWMQNEMLSLKVFS